MQSKLAIFCSLIAVALLLPTGTAQAEDGKPHVLVIQSYHKEYPWDATYLEGIRKTLTAHATITTFEMDTKRLPKETFPERARLAFEAYQASKPDLVIVGDDNATKMLAAQISEAGTPVIFLGVNANPRAYDLVGKERVGGVLERPLIKRSIRSAKGLIGEDVDKALVLFDDSVTSGEVFKDQFKGQNLMSMSGSEVELRQTNDFATWKSHVSGAKQEGFDVIIVGLHQTLKDSDGTHQAGNDVIAWTGGNSPLPVMALWKFSVGPGKALGGMVIDGVAQGERAGQMALAYLNGDADALEIVTGEKGRHIFSRSGSERWALDIPEKYKADFTD